MSDSRRHPRFGINAKLAQQALKRWEPEPQTALVEHPQTLHVPLYHNSAFAFNKINPAEYSFYLLPVSPSTLNALNAALQSNDEDDLQPDRDITPQPDSGSLAHADASSLVKTPIASEFSISADAGETRWGGKSSMARGSRSSGSAQTQTTDKTAVRMSPSSHEVLLQNLVENAAKFIPARFCDAQVNFAAGQKEQKCEEGGQAGLKVFNERIPPV